jgi:hypothetical protein
MADKDDSEKARLYARVAHLPPAVLLDRMRLHGFWPGGEALPPDPPEEAAERARLEKELAELRKRHAVIKEPEKALAEERKRRWEESKKRRAARKEERRAAHARWVEVWQRVRRETVDHLGEGVSGGLGGNVSDAAALASRGLPVVHYGAQLAAAIGVPLSRLKWLTYHRRGATVVHYHRYEVAKRTGGVRCISAPKPSLKAAQAWVLEHVLARVPVEPAAHGFVPGRSIVTNARPHVGRAVVVNLDLKDFFPTITFRRVKGVFAGLGYGEQVATVLALLCTEPPRVEAGVGGRRYYVALGARVLPQGACTSPAVTNVLCRKLDKRLAGLAGRLGFAYTRYADDLTFSATPAPAGARPAVGRLLRGVRMVVAAEGFAEHAAKTHVMRRGGRQEVTGVTVNDRTTLDRGRRRELRAILHNAAKHGLASQNRDGRADFAAYLRGRVAFACMVDTERAEAWRARLRAALAGP